MRLIDTVFRQGHLSEQALIGAVMSGERPAHLDRCDICAERAVQLARWMNEVQQDGTELADAAFTPERLQAQQQQILRRLEQLDHPARVIAFPAAARPEPSAGGRRVAVSWVAVAAAAGLVIGVVSGQMSARLSPQPVQPAATNVSTTSDPTLASNEAQNVPVDGSFLAQPYETYDLPSLEVVNAMTPRISQASIRK